MRREGRVRGQPTSKSRSTGRCRAGKTRCRGCRDHPVDKSRPKRMGRYKRFATDVRINPSLADFCLQHPSLKQLQVISSLPTDERFSDRRYEDDENAAVEVGILVATTVNSVIDAAFARMLSGSGISAVEEAFYRRELGAVEDSSFSAETTQFARMWELGLSEDSWSDVELSESGSEDDDDDWTMVDGNDV